MLDDIKTFKNGNRLTEKVSRKDVVWLRNCSSTQFRARCDEASLRIFTEVGEEWKDIVHEYFKTDGIIKEHESSNSITNIDV